MNKKVVIFTGGTGGHVNPGENFGKYLIKNKFNCTMICDYRGLKFIKDFDGKIIQISASHLSGNFFHNFIGIIKLFFGFFYSVFLIIKLKPDIAISFGSYASVCPSLAVCLMKFIRNIEYYIHEQNSIIGRSNSFFAKFANKIFVNYDINYKIDKHILSKIYVVGLPQNINKYNINTLEKKHSVKFTIFIYGGSQGSFFIMNFLEQILKILDVDTLKDFYFVVQCPDEYKNKITKLLKNLPSKYLLKNYFYNIDEILSHSNLLVSRAGAGSIDDIIKYQIPSIIIPLSSSKDNHQEKNASILSKLNCILIVNEKKTEISNIKIFIKKILKNYKNKKKFEKIIYKDANEIMFKMIKNEK